MNSVLFGMGLVVIRGRVCVYVRFQPAQPWLRVGVVFAVLVLWLGCLFGLGVTALGVGVHRRRRGGGGSSARRDSWLLVRS